MESMLDEGIVQLSRQAAPSDRYATAFQDVARSMALAQQHGYEYELSIVMPCLNEADTIATCVKKAMKALADGKIHGEVIVADNGSTDGSQKLAADLGARVVPVDKKGYGNALQGGIAAARGRFIIMGDADDSYDWLEAPKFVHKLREGFGLVQGCRLPVGGGRVMPGAMPWSHRWIGNPGLTAVARHWFGIPIHDVYCGMRGFTRELYNRLDLQSPGMEFATEMIIKAARYKADIAETPITLHKDGRIAHPPHLRTMRDGWRTLRFFLLSSPRWLFWRPGLILTVLGVMGYMLALPGISIGGVHFAMNTLMFASLLLIIGSTAAMFALAMKTMAVVTGVQPPDKKLDRFYTHFNVERGSIAGLIGGAMGLAMIGVVVVQWVKSGFADLNYEETFRWIIPGATVATLSLQLILFSFFVGVLNSMRSYFAREKK
jgi:glycosyltransferase involved in cell wall biosynthesis